MDINDLLEFLRSNPNYGGAPAWLIGIIAGILAMYPKVIKPLALKVYGIFADVQIRNSKMISEHQEILLEQDKRLSEQAKALAKQAEAISATTSEVQQHGQRITVLETDSEHLKEANKIIREELQLARKENNRLLGDILKAITRRD